MAGLMAGGGLGGGLVLVQPAIGVQFDGGDLGSGQTRANEWRESFAGVVAAQTGHHHPEISLGEVLWDTAAAVVNGSQLRLSGDIALLGGPDDTSESLPARRVSRRRRWHSEGPKHSGPRDRRSLPSGEAGRRTQFQPLDSAGAAGSDFGG